MQTIMVIAPAILAIRDMEGGVMGTRAAQAVHTQMG